MTPDDNSPQRSQQRAEAFFQSSVDDYDALHYGAGHRSFMSVRFERLIEELDMLKPQGAALDGGCGPGYMSEALLARGYETHAMDLSAEMLRLTGARCAEAGAMLTRASLEQLPFADASFNVLHSSGVIEYFADDKQALAEFHRVLVADGHLLLPCTNRWSPVGCLEFLIEAMKRSDPVRGVVNWLLRRLGQTEVRPRPFQVRKHSPGEFRRAVEAAGFEIVSDGYFCFLPWPHPFDRIFPGLTDRLGKRLEWLKNTPLRGLGEGYYVVAKRL